MEEKKEYLTEESYLKAKKKITIIAIVIFVVFLVVGGGLIFIGQNKKAEQEKANTELLKTNQERLSAIATEKIDIVNQITSKQEECDTMDMTAENWFSNHHKCQNERSDLQDKLTDLDTEEFKLENYIYASYNNFGYTMFGVFIIVAGGMIALSVYFIAKRREIAAFSTQQIMPVAKEGIEKMNPTIAKARGEIAKEIARGIKEGLKEDTDNTNTENKQ